MSLNTLSGGAFQNIDGAPLSNGFLVFELSHDEQETTTSPNGQVVAGLRKTVYLDNNGNVVAGSTMWANDSLNPANSFYFVTAYDSTGKPVWKYPQQVTVTSSPSPFVLGTIVPSNPPSSGGAAVGSLLLQTNGTNNGSQSLLNLANGNNITITDGGAGTVTIAATGGPTFSGNGAWFYGPGITDAGQTYGSTYWNQAASNLANGAYTANQVVVYIFQLFVSYTISKVSAEASNNVGAVHSTFGIYTQAGSKVVDGGNFLASTGAGVQTNTITPVTLTPGVYYHAQAATTTNSGMTFFPGIQISSSASNNTIPSFVANFTKRVAIAANALSGGTLPATLGTLTAFTPSQSNGDSIVCPLYE